MHGEIGTTKTKGHCAAFISMTIQHGDCFELAVHHLHA